MGVPGETQGLLPLAQRNPRAVLFVNVFFWLGMATQQCAEGALFNS